MNCFQKLFGLDQGSEKSNICDCGFPGNCRYHISEREAEGFLNGKNRKYNGKNQEKCLYQICPDNGFVPPLNV